MELYTKFESRSSRAKAVAFHPTRPWVLVGLYSSTIQLWDYRMGWIIDRFEGHQGPVRGLDVHPTQQIFVSCGDDQLVRVWSLTDRRLLFSLEGHQDYVRTVFFHKELPWIVSSSDDQTIRIWDWQARKEIAVLTGHNHWVSCAVFHPTEDLIISSSLDCTVRAWDISGLKRRHSAAGVLPNGASGAVGGFPGGFPGGLPSGFPGNASSGFPPVPSGMGPLGFPTVPNGLDDDFFGSEVVTKFVLEGHDRGVTWVACHPSQPLIVSSSDDRTLKVWRMSESRAWEIDTCRGHRDEVTSCAFDPFADVIVSCSTDETIRTWDINKRTPIMTFERDRLKSESADRYWNIALHPTSNLIGSALDNGATVFKLSYERPAYITSPQLTFVGHDKLLRDTKGNSSVSLAQPVCGQPLPPFAISYNPAENSILASYGVSDKKLEESFFVLYSLSGNSLSTSSSITKTQRGPANNARFISRNRFCTLLNDGTIEIRDMNNSRTKEIKPPIECRTFEVTPISGQLLLIGSKTVVLFDLQQRQVISKISAENVRRAVWSPNGNHVALLSKHDIVIATKHLEPVTKIFETIRVKALAWDKDLPVVVYSTFSHLKYGLLNGDNGVLRTMEEITYVAEVSKSEVTLLTRRSSVETVTIDPTEYRFKLALINKNFAEVARLIENSQLVGQSIIAYLQKRGYPEIALEFVQDPKSRLDLAVESGNLEVAAQAASQLQGSEFDDVLASAALEQGNHDLLEDVYQRQRDFDKLAFVYLETGNRSRLQRLEQLAMQRGDASARFQTSLFLNSAETRIELLQQAGLAPLAYALAKSQGLSDEADQIREDSGVDESDIKITISDAANGLTAPTIVHETYNANWPIEKRDKVDIMSLAKLSIHDKQSNSTSQAKSAATQTADALLDDEELDGDAWDLDDQLEEDDGDLLATAEGGREASTAKPAGGASPSVTKTWVNSSTVPADHIAAGSFETAAQLLNRQIGVVRFEPLKSRFFDVYSGSKLAMPGHEGLAPLPYFVCRDSENKLPYIPGLDHLQTRLSEAFNQVKANQLELAVDSFRDVLHTIVTLAVATESEEAEARKVVETCKHYILAFSIELKRRALPKEDVKRNLELASYFTKPKLRAAHAVLPLRTAAVQASNAKNYSLASHFAAEYLKVDSHSPAAKKMSANKAKWDALKGLDPLDIDFDMFAEFDVDPKSLTPIYEGQPVVTDPLTKAKYHAHHKGEVCVITGFTEVGASASGLRLKA